jgi:nucleoside-diphosphate-sugar epimerase
MATYIQMSDAARAVRLALAASRPGHTPLNIVSPEPFFAWSLADFERDYGVVPAARIPSDQKVPISFRRAQEMLGFTASAPLFQKG